MEAEKKQREEMEARMEEMIQQRIYRGRAAENRGRKSVEDGPNVPIHAEFCIEYGSTFATATDAIPFTSVIHNYSCESLDTLISPIKYLTYF